MIPGKAEECLPVPALHHTHVVGEASFHPLGKAGDEVEGRRDLHQAVVTQQMSAGLLGAALEHNQVVLVVHDPEPEHRHLHADLDCGVQTARLLSVEVPGEAGTEGTAHWLTELCWGHAAVPESESVGVVLQPVGQVDSTAAQQFAHQAAQGALHVSLAGDGETLRGEPGQGHVRPLTQPCRPG